MIGKILSFLGGGTLERMSKIFFGNREAREHNAHSENIAGFEQYAAEFQDKSNRTWWDSLVDGINRLMRPTGFFSIVAYFVICIVDPEYGALITVPLAQIPELMWYLCFIIFGFLFPSRLIEKNILSSNLKSLQNMNASAFRDNLKLIREVKEDIEKIKVEREEEKEKQKLPLFYD